MPKRPHKIRAPVFHNSTKTLVALVGMQFRGTGDLVKSLPAGEPLILKREPDNRFDPNAVMVFARGTHLGYIAAKQVKDIAARMDAMGRPDVYAKLALHSGSWPLIELD